MPEHGNGGSGDRLSDEDVQRIARAIFAQAWPGAGERPSEHLLSQSHELPREDGQRVSDAIERMLALRSKARNGKAKQ
jgi:hypothetical protein